MATTTVPMKMKKIRKLSLNSQRRARIQIRNLDLLFYPLLILLLEVKFTSRPREDTVH